MRISKISLLCILVLLAALIPALPAAADPPFTAFTCVPNGPSENTEYGSWRVTGAAFHSWDWVYVNPIACTDPRVTGDYIVGPDSRANVAGNGYVFTLHGTGMIVPSDPNLGGYWELRGALTPGVDHVVGHGRGAFAGLQISFENVYDDPDYPFGVMIGRIIEH